jgi:hypothetical protein
MSDALDERLNQILPRVIADDFLSGRGIGNEIAIYVFDYPPEAELRVRDSLRTLLDHLPKHRPGLRVQHVDLFDFVLDYLRSRKLLDKALQMQRDQGDDRADILVNHCVLVELKVAPVLDSRDQAQLLNALKATGTKVGLLINFGKHKAEFKRLIF